MKKQPNYSRKGSVGLREYLKQFTEYSRTDPGLIAYSDYVIIIKTNYTKAKPLLAAPCQVKAQEVRMVKKLQTDG